MAGADSGGEDLDCVGVPGSGTSTCAADSASAGGATDSEDAGVGSDAVRECAAEAGPGSKLGTPPHRSPVVLQHLNRKWWQNMHSERVQEDVEKALARSGALLPAPFEALPGAILEAKVSEDSRSPAGLAEAAPAPTPARLPCGGRKLRPATASIFQGLSDALKRLPTAAPAKAVGAPPNA
eukprot:CAMPEP_0198593034 /NCGR_PEP_ID=MMETSP1462-20131121/138892_1 /TAXON_ID=1333877 /ORGANISM="Brandtodinium nutriculum, Strain RCC3387" /LENGTH=180 /DNA_ID=CAMNT_0044324631 /DNA_START=29 /DNA_END=567 /DNA_ORIENTATION=-